MKVIYMMADTFRRDHVGAYGNDWIRTPNLDRLAAQSAVFDQAYIGSFPTVPNRRDTLLGRGDLGLPFNRWKPLERQEVTLPARLAERGIVSMWIGDTQNNVTGNINLVTSLYQQLCGKLLVDRVVFCQQYRGCMLCVFTH